MKAQECILILHGITREIGMGAFPSKRKAREYVNAIDWRRPYTIKPVKPQTK